MNHNGAFPTWAQWQASYDANGVNEDPTLTDPGNGDFTLQAGSPCIDAGVDVGLDRDFANRAIHGFEFPDIGAFEFFTARTSPIMF